MDTIARMTNDRPTAKKLPDGTSVFPAPSNVPPEEFQLRLADLRSQGMGSHMASRIARTELIRKYDPQRPWDRVHAPLDSNDSPQDREARIKALEAFSKRYGTKSG